MSTTVATVNLTNQSAGVSSTTLYSVTTAGQYRISFNAKVTQAASTRSQLGGFNFTYVDPDGTTVSLSSLTGSAAGALAQKETGTEVTVNNGNALTSALFGYDILLNCEASSIITYEIGYSSTGATPMEYNANIVVEQL